jgi:hypothetical protein
VLGVLFAPARWLVRRDAGNKPCCGKKRTSYSDVQKSLHYRQREKHVKAFNLQRKNRNSNLRDALDNSLDTTSLGDRCKLVETKKL